MARIDYTEVKRAYAELGLTPVQHKYVQLSRLGGHEQPTACCGLAAIALCRTKGSIAEIEEPGADGSGREVLEDRIGTAIEAYFRPELPPGYLSGYVMGFDSKAGANPTRPSGYSYHVARASLSSSLTEYRANYNEGFQDGQDSWRAVKHKAEEAQEKELTCSA